MAYKGHKDSNWQLNSDLAPSIAHWHDDQEVLDSIPVGFCAEMTPHQKLLYLSSATEASVHFGYLICITCLASTHQSTQFTEITGVQQGIKFARFTHF